MCGARGACCQNVHAYTVDLLLTQPAPLIPDMPIEKQILQWAGNTMDEVHNFIVKCDPISLMYLFWRVSIDHGRLWRRKVYVKKSMLS